MFLLHQLTSTLGVGLLVSGLSVWSLQVLQILNQRALLNLWFLIFAYRPYFPVQIALALYFGWTLDRRFNGPRTVLVWVAPSALLLYAVAALPTLTPALTPPTLWAGQSQSAFTHYFGWGCQPKDGCFDGRLLTMPVYTSVAYSVGAWFASLAPRSKSRV